MCKGKVVADISLGNIEATLRFNTGDFQRQLQDIVTRLQQLQQSMQQFQQGQQTSASQTAQSTVAMQAMALAIREQTQAYAAAQAASLQYRQEQDRIREANRQQAQAAREAAQAARQQAQEQAQAARQIAQEQRAAAQAQSGWNQAMQVAAGLGIITGLQGIARAMRDFTTSSVEAAGRMQELRLAFRTLEGSSESAARTMTQLFATAQRLGTPFEQTARSFRGLEAAARGTTLEGENIHRIFEQIAGSSRVLGTTQEELRRIFLAFEQMLAKGKGTAEELNQQLSEASPLARGIIAEQLGVTTAALTRMVEAGLVPATTMMLAFGEGVQKLKEQSGVPEQIDLITASLNRLTNEWNQFKAGLGQGLGQAAQPAIESLAGWVRRLRESMDLPGPSGAPASRDLTRFPLGTYIQNPFQALIAQYTAATGTDPTLVSRQIQAESYFRPGAIGPRTPRGQAVGLMQVLPSTAGDYENLGMFPQGALQDPATNIRIGTRVLQDYDKQIQAAFGILNDRTRLVFAAYNAGIGTIINAIRATQAAGQEPSFENVIGRTAQSAANRRQTEAYVQFIAGNRPVPYNLSQVQGEQTLADAMAPALTSAQGQGRVNQRILDDLMKQVQRTLQELPKIEQEFDRLMSQGQNIGGILDESLSKQGQRAQEEFAKVLGILAQLPDAMARLTPEQQKQLTLANEQVAAFRLRVQEAIKNPELELLKRENEQLERLIIQRRAAILAQEQGRSAAEQFAREATAAQAQQQLQENRENAMRTREEQVVLYRRRVQELTETLKALGVELENIQAQEALPGINAQLSRVEQFLQIGGQSAAAQAAEAVQTQGAEIRRNLTRVLQEVAQNPALLQIAPTLVQQIESYFNLLADKLPSLMDAAYTRIDEQQRRAVSQLGDQIEAMAERIGDAGLTPMDAALARVRRTFAEMARQFDQMRERLVAARETATEAGKAEIDARLARLNQLTALLPEAQERDEFETRMRPEREQLSTLRRQLLQLQAQRNERAGVRAELSVQDVDSPEGRQAAQYYIDRIKAQERLNYYAGLFEQLGERVGSAWTSALSSVAQGTQSVAQAFRQMTQSIMLSISQLAAQEGFKALMRLGFGLITGAFAPTVSPIDTAGTLGAAESTEPPPLLFGGSGLRRMQFGGVVNKPTVALLGESPSTSPEYVLTRQQMQAVMSRGIRGGPTAGGQALGAVHVHNHPDQASAERGAADDMARGETAVVNAVMRNLRSGESSSIMRTIRTLQR